MALVEQELPTLPKHTSSFPVLSKDRVARYLVFCVVLWKSLSVLFVAIRCWSFMCGHSLSVLFVWHSLSVLFVWPFVVGTFCVAIRCRSFLDVRLLLDIAMSVLLRITDSYYLFFVFKLLF